MNNTRKFAWGLFLTGALGMYAGGREINKIGDQIKSLPVTDLESRIIVKIEDLQKMYSPNSQEIKLLADKYTSARNDYVKDLENQLTEVRAHPNYESERKKSDELQSFLLKVGGLTMLSLILAWMSAGYLALNKK